MMRPATAAEIERWDELVLANPDGGQILQTKAWGDFKGQSGWQPRRYIYDLGERQVAIQFLSRSIPLLGELWYSSRGPGVTKLGDFAQLVKQTQAEAFAIMFDPEVVEEEASPSYLASHGLRLGSDVQLNRATIIVDLKPGEDELLAGFKQKTRYNLRLAERKGVTVEPVAATAENCRQMFELYRSMMGRTGFFLRSLEYFSGYWQAQAQAGQGQLFFARYQDQLLAGAFVTYLGQKAWYKDGGSVRERRELMAPYLLQWEVMRWLKAKGIEQYDLVAVPTKAELSPQHYMYGLYQFKSGFSAEITQYIGTWDLPLKQLKYRLWKPLGERVYRKYLAKVRKELLY